MKCGTHMSSSSSPCCYRQTRPTTPPRGGARGEEMSDRGGASGSHGCAGKRGRRRRVSSVGEVPAERRLMGWGIGEPWSRRGQPDPTLGATAAPGCPSIPRWGSLSHRGALPAGALCLTAWVLRRRRTSAGGLCACEREGERERRGGKKNR